MLGINKVLVPIDLSENGLKVLPYAKSIAAAYDCSIQLLHVVEDVRLSSIRHLANREEIQAELIRAAEGRMAKVCAEEFRDHPGFQRKIITGHAPVEILQIIEAEQVDWVIMGTHGFLGLGHTLFGSVAENVMKKSPVPVLTINSRRIKVPPEDRWEIKHILFPVDFTEQVSKILPHVLNLSEKFGATVHLLHVVDDAFRWGQIYSLAWNRQEVARKAKDIMDGICAEQMQGCPNFEKKVVFGETAATILKMVESEQIDLVMMGTHGRKGLGHTLFGSVAENVVKQATVPVWVANPYKI